jgi:hypothetical protein
VYRAPQRAAGSIRLDNLQGFALVSETRVVHLPAGESRLRFEGVADGIEAVSAIVTGLPDRVIEKNRDARLLSPSALLAATEGKSVDLLRALPKHMTERLTGTLLSGAEGGVMFKSEQGIEALRCSGLAETFSFEPVADLSARPTLSVLVRSAVPATRTVTLSYLARNFDWAADYTATLSADGRSLDLGAWVTLANSNGTGFPSAHVQVVAGRLNREEGVLEPIDIGGPILATCWPRGSTSDIPLTLSLNRRFETDALAVAAPMATAMRKSELAEVAFNGAMRVKQEQLGDLKLYRVPERTTLAARQSKQVRLMDRQAIPVSIFYSADFAAAPGDYSAPATRLLRTRNIPQSNLGLPLPSGSVAVFALSGGQRLLEHESEMRDLAVGEEVEIAMGSSADVQISTVKEKALIDPQHAQLLPLVPGVRVHREVKVDEVQRVEISNAKSSAISFELRLSLQEGGRVIRADHPLGSKNGRPIFRLTIPANGRETLRYQTQQTASPVSRP